MAIQQLTCPNCGSIQTRYRKRYRDYRCLTCDHVFKPTYAIGRWIVLFFASVLRAIGKWMVRVTEPPKIPKGQLKNNTQAPVESQPKGGIDEKKPEQYALPDGKTEAQTAKAPKTVKSSKGGKTA